MTERHGARAGPALLGALALLLGFAGHAAAEELSGRALVEALRGGGYTIYFRHAQTDWRSLDLFEKPEDWKSCDPEWMRQLSEAGRETAKAVGAAVRALGIPVGLVLSSEFCRAAETARLLDLGPVETTTDIINMNAAPLLGGPEAVVARARRLLSTPPPAGTNTVVVGHGNLMRAATETHAGEAGAGVFAPSPGSESGVALVALIAPEDWAKLARSFGAEP